MTWAPGSPVPGGMFDTNLAETTLANLKIAINGGTVGVRVRATPAWTR